jgi:hypothetical protein
MDYLGADIVADLVEVDNARYGGPGRRFIVADITADPLPRVDLVLCRDGMVHFCDTHVHQALANFARSGSTYLLATTYAGTKDNVDITSGWWRPVNLCRPPFNLPPPLLQLPDAASDDFYPEKALALWRIADLV